VSFPGFLVRLPAPPFFLFLGGAVTAAGINYVSTLGLGGVERDAGWVAFDAGLWVSAGVAFSLLGQALQEAKDGALRLGGSTPGVDEIRALERDQLARHSRRVGAWLGAAVCLLTASIVVAVLIYGSAPESPRSRGSGRGKAGVAANVARRGSFSPS
jgi:hypothetical protein